MTTIDGSTRFERPRDDVSGAVDDALRRDVGFLGALLGRVLRESGGVPRWGAP
jgi:phosphoenolpyruvate carboxylase